MNKPLRYFDYAAATPLDSRVFDAMKPFFEESFANPSSIYGSAQAARHAIDEAREKTGRILECDPREILFTSGGTESNNLFILGAAEFYSNFGRHIITTKIEHDSILKPLEFLESKGFEVTYLDVDGDGFVDPEKVAEALRKDTIFATVMYANNEIGTIQPIKKIAEVLAKFRRSMQKQRAKFRSRSEILPGSLPFFHTDACQAAPFLDVSVKNLGVDAMTLNGGKIYGPKGSGILYIKEGLKITPQIHGGGQEYRMRSGTENVPAIVGFAKALEIAQRERKKESARLAELRDKLITGILEKIPSARLNGGRLERLPNNANVSFKGLEGETILFKLDMHGIEASAGSACTSGSLKTSHVIKALGLPEEWARSATRFTLGRASRKKDIDAVLRILPQIIAELFEISPFA